MNPVNFYKCLADETRLRCLLLIIQEQELCVCELMAALKDSQPKISRHLALLRKVGILQDRRRAQWVFYQLNPDLPHWAIEVLRQTLEHNPEFINNNRASLQQMGERPKRIAQCC